MGILYDLERGSRGALNSGRCLTIVKKETAAMADQKDKAKEKKKQEESSETDKDEQASGQAMA